MAQTIQRQGLLQRLALILLIGACAPAVLADVGKLPQNCVESCATPYGEILGTTRQGTQAYSNCQSSCVVFEPNHDQGTYTGIKWQCVEYARRWLMQQRGLSFGDVDVAADIWALKSLQRLSDQTEVLLKAFENGAQQRPRRGDMLVYGREYLGTGHAAIVLQVDTARGRLYVAEQNFNNRKWSGRYARSIPLIRRDGQYWVLDAYLLGWMRTQ